MNARWGIGFVLLALAACDPPPPDRDAGLDAATVDSGPPDAGPSSSVPLPAPPDHGECPPGWRSVEVEGARLCDPWPATGIEECTAPEEAHFAGGPGCERVGTACDGDFAPDLPASGVFFVRAGAAGGDGTRARPFGTIAAALAVATPGTTVALSADRFVQDQIDLPEGVTLHGACVAGTVLRSEAADPGAFVGVVQVTEPAGGLRNLRVEGERVGIEVNGGAVEVRDVVVAEAVQAGIQVVNGGELTATRLVVRDTRPIPTGLWAGEGVDVQNRGRATITSAVFARNYIVAVGAQGMGSSLTLTDAAIHHTRSDAASAAMGRIILGVGLQGNGGATVEASNVAVDRASYAGIRALGAGTTVRVDRAVVRDVAQSGNITGYGAGVIAETGASLSADRVWVERASYIAALSVNAGSTLALRDALVRDTQIGAHPTMGTLLGVGFSVAGTAELTLERVVSAASTFAGVLIQDSSRATVTDLVVRDTRANPDGLYGRGLEVVTGATATVTRALLQRNRELSVSVYHAGTTLEARDVTVRDSLANADGDAGYGAQVAGGATLTLTGADIEASRGNGVLAAEAGTRVIASGIRIADVRPLDCAATTCPGGSFAYGAAAIDGAALQMSRFEVENAAEAALQLAMGGEADLSEGTIADTPIGFNVQTAGFDESRLRDRVTFTNVTVELDLSALQIAAGLPPFGI